MPYVDHATRKELRAGRPPQTPGELNYIVTLYLIWYLKTKGMSYQAINDCLGALEGAKMELYRRKGVPYENTKLATNGDVYDEPL